MKKLTRMLKTGVLLAGMAAAAGSASAQTVLNVSTWLPPSHGATMAQNQWCEAVEKETAGSVKCNLLPKAVSAPPGTFDAVRDGLADVSYTVDGYTPGRFIFTQVAEFPFLGDS
ncbi:MAG: ABC transporter substrate-binding protein, partial [Pannonibacter indicus]